MGKDNLEQLDCPHCGKPALMIIKKDFLKLIQTELAAAQDRIKALEAWGREAAHSSLKTKALNAVVRWAARREPRKGVLILANNQSPAAIE